MVKIGWAKAARQRRGTGFNWPLAGSATDGDGVC